MSLQYDYYLHEHIWAVQKAHNWIEGHLPEIIPLGFNSFHIIEHDASKYSTEEYDAYDLYFYGKNEDVPKEEVQEIFDAAFLHHIHHNPHHWQYWVLYGDDENLDGKPLRMPYKYILEMICDWWSFSWRKGNLYEIFDWYEGHKDKMRLHVDTKTRVEDILDKIREKLTELDKKEGILEENEAENS